MDSLSPSGRGRKEGRGGSDAVLYSICYPSRNGMRDICLIILGNRGTSALLVGSQAVGPRKRKAAYRYSDKEKYFGTVQLTCKVNSIWMNPLTFQLGFSVICFTSSYFTVISWLWWISHIIQVSPSTFTQSDYKFYHSSRKFRLPCDLWEGEGRSFHDFGQIIIPEFELSAMTQA